MRLKQIGSAGNKTRRYHERPNETSNTEVKETMKVAITAKRVVILMMTMALAVALVACSGAAGKPGEAGKDAEPLKLAPFKVGKIPAMPLVVGGKPGTVDLSEHFSDPAGRALTYTATSSMMAHATVKVDKMTLTVTAVAAGESTITVTATNLDKLMAKQTFMATVSPEADMEEEVSDDDSDEEEFDYTLEVDGKQPIPIQKGQFVHSSDEAVVEVHEKTTTSVELVARSKGNADVTVYSEAGEEVRVYKVKVNNRPPARTKEMPDAIYEITLVGAPKEIKDTHGLSNVYMIDSIDLGSLYEDPDGQEDLVFSARSVNRGTAVVAGLKSDGSAIYVDVLDGSPEFFTIIVEATDKDKAPGVPILRIKVRNMDPLQQTYQAIQRSSGSYSIATVRVTYRKLPSGAQDMIMFEGDNVLNANNTPSSYLDSPFAFTKSIMLPPSLVTHDASAAVVNPTPEDITTGRADTAGYNWYTVSKTGSTKITLGETALTMGDTGATPATKHMAKLPFRAEAKTARATVTIKYTVVPESGGIAAKDKKVMRNFTIAISPVMEDPVTVK